MTLLKLFNQIEARPQGMSIKDAIPSNLWVWYIQQVRELTGENIIVKKCVRCLIMAHGYLSDYYKK